MPSRIVRIASVNGMDPDEAMNRPKFEGLTPLFPDVRLRLEVEDGVGTIRIDRPKMNALNAQVQEEIRAAATEATERDDVRAVVVYGGDRVFAAGADIKEMADMSYTDMVARSGSLQSAFTAVAKIPKPVVAAVTGYALGGGCELALCADYRIAADRRVSTSSSRLGAQRDGTQALWRRGNDVDHAEKCIRSVQSGCRSAYDLDLFYRAQRDQFHSQPVA